MLTKKRGEKKMARIRHIALLTKDTEKLAEFYRTSFGLNEVARSGETSENGRAIYLSDGHINLAILPARLIGARESTTSAWKSMMFKTPRRPPNRTARPAAHPSFRATAASPKRSFSIRWARASICHAAGKFRDTELSRVTEDP